MQMNSASLNFQSLSSTSGMLLNTMKSVSGPVRTGLMNKVNDRMTNLSDNLSDDEFKKLKAAIISVMESIVYLGDIGEQSTPENIQRMASNCLHTEIVLDLADVLQALDYGSKKAIFTCTSRISQTWAIDTKNIDLYKDNNEYSQFLLSLASDSKNRSKRIKEHFDATKRKINPIVSYSQIFQEGSKQDSSNEQARIVFSDLGLKENVADPASDPSSYQSRHEYAALNPTSIHYAARHIIRGFTQMMNQSGEIVDFDDNQSLSKLDLLEKGAMILSTTPTVPSSNKVNQQSGNNDSNKDGPTWKTNVFPIQHAISSGKKPGKLSGFSIVPRRVKATI